uniref:ATP synthase subunit b, chloroplastic n=1 Tax=Dasyclonium flaccidum TaxID=2007274 RepID=A0A1Z1MKN2_9FLOR|nr:ATP synthase CF0 subunit I [Dasyclonium flaccidum]ARW66618.1 ATP synthase CF0 subunit I [Dasyclonium flaccidum]
MQIFELISKEQVNAGISFNSDFLEANVLNISLLLAGLIYVLRKFLGSILLDRQNKVLFAIRESEERLEQANMRLDEAEKQLKQTQIIINQIIEEAEVTAKRVRQSIIEQGKSDIEKLTDSSKSSIKSAENQVRLQIQQQITALAIKKVSIELQSQMTSDMQTQIIHNSIIQLKDQIEI